MMEKVCNIDGIPVYSDPSMEDGKILKGRKQGVPGHTFIVANPRTANLLYETTIEYKRKTRKEKLSKINESTR